MRIEPSKIIIGIVLIFCLMLFSSNSCNKELPAGLAYCNPAVTDVKDLDTFDDPDTFTLDPPLLRYNLFGVTGVCLEESLKLFAKLNMKSGSTLTVTSKCIVETPTFAKFTLPLQIYNADGPYYQSDISVIAISTLGLKEAGWVNYVVEISWNTSTPYNSKEELVAQANQNFENFIIITTYNEYKP